MPEKLQSDVESPMNQPLDNSAVSPELNLVSELFHRINRIVPEKQKLLTLLPDTKASEAIFVMQKHGFSQVPVVLGHEVLGVFSYRSFARKAATASLEKVKQEQCAPGDLTVDEYLEDLNFSHVTDEMRSIFNHLDENGAVLIGSPDNLLGILSHMDILRYLYNVASPFVLVSEIELSLRALFRLTLAPEQIEEYAGKCLSSLYKGDVPTTLEQMSFDNYRSIVSNKEGWPKFEPILGGTRLRATAKLKQIADVRNVLFHFKREISLEEHEMLSGHRDWLLNRLKQAELRRKAGPQ